ncbi:MAG: NUDIX hydrolase [Telmatospirillum sp.]|nr:NUDIX hydrolase [Telmatospirillum sp.]
MNADDMPPVRRLGRRAIFENRVWRVFADAIADKNGAQVPDYLVLEAKAVPANAIGGVAVLPILADGRIALLRNWRHAIGGWSWEAAKGFVETGEDPAAAAMRELAEETGLACQAADLVPLGTVHPEPAAMATRAALYVARNCTALTDHVHEADEAGLGRVAFFEAPAADALWQAGEMRDAASLLLLARRADALRSP